MRTENQIKSKINELTLQKKSLMARIDSAEPDTPAHASLNAQLLRLEDMISMLEWVLHEPSGSYHM
ncbi:MULTISPECIES: hypothetical protein [Paenibacillus]|uniref:Uncharacterized protein n=1 Tax=Paenibacillus albilobatus TaxID=2716884 RepID=A0A920C9Q0_9BACL|nr:MULTISPECIES: hypothetical protein [Paenibacillus]MDR9854469.1 hypothetical protein [Paenibacillus sp. VCA1]GIO30073.1 hypothetical protein J2TS6_12140 [Paenibacillus albilobatus]